MKTDKEFQAKTKLFQAQFMKLFDVHKALMTGDDEEATKYQAYMTRLGAIQANESLGEDARDDLLADEQDNGALSEAASTLSAGDDELFANLHDAMSRVELVTAMVNTENNRPSKRKPSKTRAAAAA